MHQLEINKAFSEMCLKQNQDKDWKQWLAEKYKKKFAKISFERGSLTKKNVP